MLRSLVDDEGMTIIIATYDLAAAQAASVVYHLRDGQLAAAEPGSDASVD